MTTATAVSFVPLSVPEIRGNEWTYVKECLDTGWVSSVGGYVERFERALAAQVGTRFAVATVNGTAALHIALLTAGVEPDDLVLVSSLSFVAPANAIRYAGAWPVFVDAEPDYWQMDPGRVVDFLERRCRWQRGALYHKESNRRVRAILPVHILGHPVNMDPISEIARRFGLAIVEDATESLGADYRGTAVGRLGRIGCFSFNGNKLITTGGGGMLVTDDERIAERARYLTTQAKDAGEEYIHREIGYNYRLTNLQAAMGVAQLEQLPEYLAAKRRIAAAYAAALGDVCGITVMREAEWARSAWWMYTVLVNERAFGVSARGLLQLLERERIQTRPLWQPLHRSAAHRGALAVGGAVAEGLYREALSLPCSVGLMQEAQDRVIAAIATARQRGAAAAATTADPGAFVSDSRGGP